MISNYKFPLLTANKVITNGPDKTIRANTISCATTSKFIRNLTVKNVSYCEPILEMIYKNQAINITYNLIV
jgi:hypothetical protein